MENSTLQGPANDWHWYVAAKAPDSCSTPHSVSAGAAENQLLPGSSLLCDPYFLAKPVQANQSRHTAVVQWLKTCIPELRLNNKISAVASNDQELVVQVSEAFLACSSTYGCTNGNLIAYNGQLCGKNNDVMTSFLSQHCCLELSNVAQ